MVAKQTSQEWLPLRFDLAIDEGTAWIRPVGELDMASAPWLEARISHVADAGPREIVLDLEGLSFMDASGVHLVLRCSERAAAAGIRFKLHPARPAIQRIFVIAGVENLLPFCRRHRRPRFPRSNGHG